MTVGHGRANGCEKARSWNDFGAPWADAAGLGAAERAPFGRPPALAGRGLDPKKRVNPADPIFYKKPSVQLVVLLVGGAICAMSASSVLQLSRLWCGCAHVWESWCGRYP